MSQSQQPQLSPLYFAHTGGASLTAGGATAASAELPLEVLHQCLTAYCDWGDLAKLACVQRSWSRVLYDAADYSDDAKWCLAQALFHGSSGLQANPAQAMVLFLQLANVEKDNANNMPLLVPLTNKQQQQYQQCFAPAMKQIAACYLTGQGVANVDTAAGMAWLQAAHNNGHDADAAHEVAVIYEYGKHAVETDVVQAAVWFTKAAEAGNMEAMAELGLCYELGCGVEQSDENALEWYTKAANKGHLTSKYSVGEAFEEARGVAQSDEEACLWYYKAAVEGDEDSRRALRRLEAIALIVVPGVRALLDV